MRAFIVVLVLTSLAPWARRSYAQELSAGDIAVVSMNADDPDEFAFVTLVDLPAGTATKFVDHGWTEAGEFIQTEQEYLYRALSEILAGALITLGSAIYLRVEQQGRWSLAVGCEELKRIHAACLADEWRNRSRC